jgi:hypothetical protein
MIGVPPARSPDPAWAGTAIKAQDRRAGPSVLDAAQTGTAIMTAVVSSPPIKAQDRRASTSVLDPAQAGTVLDPAQTGTAISTVRRAVRAARGGWLRWRPRR